MTDSSRVTHERKKALEAAVLRRVLSGIEFDAAWFDVDTNGDYLSSEADIVRAEFKRIVNLLKRKT